MSEVTVRFGAPMDNDNGGYNFNAPLSNDPKAEISFCQIQIQTTWRRESWIGKDLTEDEACTFKPLELDSLVGDLWKAKFIVNQVFAPLIDPFGKGLKPIWVDKSRDGATFIECQIPLSLDHHMKIKVRIYLKSIKYDTKGNLYITDRSLTWQEKKSCKLVL